LVVKLLQEAVEIAIAELSAQTEGNYMLQIINLFSDITDAPNVQVEWLSNVTQRNLD